MINICEQRKGKLSYCLPNKIANNYNFVNAVSNILSNELIDSSKKIYRKLYKIKCLLKLIDELNININLEWIYL